MVPAAASPCRWTTATKRLSRGHWNVEGLNPQRGALRKKRAKLKDNNVPADATLADPYHAAASGMNDLQPESMFSRNDLRPQISQTSALAVAMAEVFAKHDPAARKYVKPASALRDFLAEHDAELAKMFRESNILN